MLSKKSTYERPNAGMGNNKLRNEEFLNQLSPCGPTSEMLFFGPMSKIIFRQHRPIGDIEWVPLTANVSEVCAPISRGLLGGFELPSGLFTEAAPELTGSPN